MLKRLHIITIVMKNEFFNLFHILLKETPDIDSASIINYLIQKTKENMLGIERISPMNGQE
jgi:hypothetical protein